MWDSAPMSLFLLQQYLDRVRQACKAAGFPSSLDQAFVLSEGVDQPTHQDAGGIVALGALAGCTDQTRATLGDEPLDLSILADTQSPEGKPLLSQLSLVVRVRRYAGLQDLIGRLQDPLR